MLGVPEEIKELFKQDNILTEETRRKWKIRVFDSEIQLLFPEDVLFPSDDLFPVDQNPFYTIDNSQLATESIILTESLFESSNLTFGECNAAQFEATVADVLLDLTGKEFMVTVEVGDYEMAMGIYTVDSFVRQADRRKKKITAYDRMRKFQTDVAEWYRGLTFPMSLKEFRYSLCAYVGITQISMTLPLDDMVVTKTIEPEKLSGLNVLQAICEINGCFGHIDKTGRLRYQFLTATSLFPSEELFPDEKLFPSDMKDGESETLDYYKQSETRYEDYVVMPIEKLQIRQEEGDVGILYGGGSNTYVIQGNFLVYGKSSDELLQIAATIYEQISSRMYRPCKIVAQALPWVEVGDGLICYTTDDVIETYCFKRTMKGIQGMMDTYEATGSIEQEENFGIQTQIIQLEGKAAVIEKNVEKVSVRVTDLKKYTESQFEITAEEILAEVKRAKDSEASLKVLADNISLSVVNLKGDMKSQFEQTDKKISFKVSKGDISSELSVESGTVTILGNRLIVKSTNFTLDEKGNATFSGDITGGTISGVKIKVGPFEADSQSVQLGDFWVSVSDNYIFASLNGRFRIDTTRSGEVSMRLGDLGELSEDYTEITGNSVYSKYIHILNTKYWAEDLDYNGELGAIVDAIWTGHEWSLERLSERTSRLEDEVSDLEDRINNMGSGGDIL